MQGFVDRFGATATKASQAQSRAKAIEKLQKNAVQMPVAASGAGPGDARKVGLPGPRETLYSPLSLVPLLSLWVPCGYRLWGPFAGTV